MSFNLTGLSTYSDELSTDLVSRALLKAQSVNYVTVRPGLTAGVSSINILGGTADIIDATCGFGAAQVGSNDVAFTQVDLCVLSKMKKQSLCPEDLRDYWLSSQMSPSAYGENVPFEAAIADYQVRQINQYVENTIWQGDGVSGSCLVGLLDQISVANGAEDGTAYAGAWTSSNADTNLWGMIDLLPDAVRQEDDLVAYMSLAQYSKLTQALISSGASILSLYPNIENATGSGVQAMQFPGTNITVFGAPGINTNQVVLGPKKAVFMGTGLIDDQDNFRFYYDHSEDIVKFMAKFRMGTAALADQFGSNV